MDCLQDGDEILVTQGEDGKIHLMTTNRSPNTERSFPGKYNLDLVFPDGVSYVIFGEDGIVDQLTNASTIWKQSKTTGALEAVPFWDVLIPGAKFTVEE